MNRTPFLNMSIIPYLSDKWGTVHVAKAHFPEKAGLLFPGIPTKIRHKFRVDKTAEKIYNAK